MDSMKIFANLGFYYELPFAIDHRICVDYFEATSILISPFRLLNIFLFITAQFLRSITQKRTALKTTTQEKDCTKS